MLGCFSDIVTKSSMLYRSLLHPAKKAIPRLLGYMGLLVTTSSFLLVSTKFFFWEESWALGYNFVKFGDVPDLS